jgi:hypothetical protein
VYNLWSSSYAVFCILSLRSTYSPQNPFLTHRLCSSLGWQTKFRTCINTGRIIILTFFRYETWRQNILTWLGSGRLAFKCFLTNYLRCYTIVLGIMHGLTFPSFLPSFLIFSLHHCVQTDSGSYPASYPAGSRNFLRGVKRPGREANHSHPYSAEVKTEWSYISTPPYIFMVASIPRISSWMKFWFVTSVSNSFNC